MMRRFGGVARYGGSLLTRDGVAAGLQCAPTQLSCHSHTYGGFDQCHQRRGIQLFQVFSEEARAKRRERLKEDLQRGYFDDFKELKDTKGKLWRAPDRLIPADAAKPFPHVQVLQPDGSKLEFPPRPEQAPTATLACIGFKAGSEDMLASWSDPFVQRFQSRNDAAVVELSIVESKVMALWPFRNMILRAPRRAAALAGTPSESPTAAAMQEAETQLSRPDGTPAVAGGQPAAGAPQTLVNPDGAGCATAEGGGGVEAGSGGGLQMSSLFYFGDAWQLCKDLGVANRLTGYTFLLDSQGRVRWRGVGKAEAEEVASLIRATRQLLEAG